MDLLGVTRNVDSGADNNCLNKNNTMPTCGMGRTDSPPADLVVLSFECYKMASASL